MDIEEPPSVGELVKGYRLATELPQEMLAERARVW